MKLVLLPGLDGTGQLFEPFLHALPIQLSPVVISYPTDKRLSYAELVQFVTQRLPTYEDYVLLAESFSGPVAIEVGATGSNNLKALILSTTFVSSPVLVPKIMSLLLSRPIFALEPPQFVVSRYLLGENPPADLVEGFRQARRSVKPDVLAFRLQNVLHVNARRAFEACHLPILYLRATQDRLVNARSLAEMKEIRPEMIVAEVDGPHLLLQREPEKCVEALVSYLRPTI